MSKYQRSPPSQPRGLSGGQTSSFIWDTNPNRIIAVEIVSLPELGKTFICANAMSEHDSDGKVTKCHSAVGDTENKAWIEMDKVGNKHLKVINNMQDFRNFVDYCLKDDGIRVVCIDSGTDLRQMAEDEFLHDDMEDKIKRVYPLVLYGRVFSKIDSQVAKLNKGGKNVIFTGRVKDEYEQQGEDGVRTGNLIRDSYKKLPYALPIIIMLHRGIKDTKGRIWFSNHIFGEVLKNSFFKKYREKPEDKLGKPWVFEPSMEGIIKELSATPWDEQDIIASAHKWLHEQNIIHDEKDTEKLPQVT